MAAGGKDNQQIAEAHGITRQKAGRWRVRYAQKGLKGIEKDAFWPERLPKYDKKVEEELVRKHSLGKANQWQRLRGETGECGGLVYVPARTRGGIFLRQEEPDTGAGSHPAWPALKKGRCGTMTHDYKRNGTTTVFAALNTASDNVIGMHTSPVVETLSQSH